ncbi:MAG: hypothetical protein IH991_06855 [Planctomycetes bacterium]|nr:hypothetical protein [Planctomycetota bacterium]
MENSNWHALIASRWFNSWSEEITFCEALREVIKSPYRAYEFHTVGWSTTGSGMMFKDLMDRESWTICNLEEIRQKLESGEEKATCFGRIAI